MYSCPFLRTKKNIVNVASCLPVQCVQGTGRRRRGTRLITMGPLATSTRGAKQEDSSYAMTAPPKRRTLTTPEEHTAPFMWRCPPTRLTLLSASVRRTDAHDGAHSRGNIFRLLHVDATFATLTKVWVLRRGHLHLCETCFVLLVLTVRNVMVSITNKF